MNTLFVPEHPKRILVCQLRQLGDVVLATPSIKLLAEHFPQSEIHFFTEKKCSPLLENNPHIHKIWCLDKKKHTNLMKELIFYKKIASNNFDIVIDFQQLPRIRWVVAMSQAPLRLAPERRWYTKWIYNTYTPHSIKPTGYAAGMKASLLNALGIEWKGEKPEIFLTKEEKQHATDLFTQLGATNNQPIISVDVSHRRRTRCWPSFHYAHLLDYIAQEFPHVQFFLPYGPGEKEDIKEIKKLSRYPENFLIPESVISLRLMAACISQCALHIGNCSAPRHIAVALDVPSFTIQGATSSGWTFPSPEHTDIRLGRSCQPCNKNVCNVNYACLYDLTPEIVFPKVAEHFRTFCYKKEK